MTDKATYRILHRENASAPIIYVIDSAEQPFDIARAAAGRASTVVSIPIANWNDALTPWPAPGFYESDPWFGGQGGATLEELTSCTLPSIERALGARPLRRAICGYSLGGLFSLYAFVSDAQFDACACISGSVWYQGWMEHLRDVGAFASGANERPDEREPRIQRPFDGRDRYAYFSVGKKERKSGLPLFRCVEDNMGECANILRSCGCEADFAVGPGNHMQHIPKRFEEALCALDAFLVRA